MTKDQELVLERLLTANLSRASDWIKFAEAKNAALLTFCSAWIAGTIAILFGSASLPDFTRNTLSLCLPVFIFSAGITLSSFLPQLNSIWGGKAKAVSHKPNLLFFGDLAKLVDAENDITSRYVASGKSVLLTNFVGDTAHQIHVNSKIAVRKFRLFDFAAKSLFLVFVCAAASAAYGIATSSGVGEYIEYIGLT